MCVCVCSVCIYSVYICVCVCIHTHTHACMHYITSEPEFDFLSPYAAIGGYLQYTTERNATQFNDTIIVWSTL